MFYHQSCASGYALDVALELMQKYHGVIIGNTCTIESGIVVFFGHDAWLRQYMQAYTFRLGPPEIKPVVDWTLKVIKQHFEAHVPPLVTERMMSARTVKTFFNELTYAWVDASLQTPKNEIVMQTITTWRDTLASDLAGSE